MLIETTEYSVLYPHHNRAYIESIWSKLQAFLHAKGVECRLVGENTLQVRTTKEMTDGCSILMAHAMTQLIAKHVPMKYAQKVFDENVQSTIYNIRKIVPNKEIFFKRRERLFGPHGQTQEAIEALTNCKLIIKESTVCIIGTAKGIPEVLDIVYRCMRNEHPRHTLKKYIEKRKLENDPSRQKDDWSIYLPVYKRSMKNPEREKVRKKIRKEKKKEKQQKTLALED